eukprot:13424520-Alexandrium_andersonii.AAC.1
MGDSQTVCSWASGTSNCTHSVHLALQNDATRRLYDCWQNCRSIPWEPTGSWVTHIYRERNKDADHLANEGAAGRQKSMGSWM